LFLGVLLVVTQAYDTTAVSRRRGFTNDALEYACNAYLWLYVLGMLVWDMWAFARDGFAKCASPPVTVAPTVTRPVFTVWWHTYDILLGLCYANAVICLLRAEAWSAFVGTRAHEARRRHRRARRVGPRALAVVGAAAHVRVRVRVRRPLQHLPRLLLPASASTHRTHARRWWWSCPW